MDNCLAPSSDGGGYGCDNMTVIIVALLHGKTKEQWYDMIVDRVKEKDGPVAPKKFGSFPYRKYFLLTIARFLGPGFNQFQNWNQRNDESSEASDDEEPPANETSTKKPPAPQQDDSEGWTDWKNGEDFRVRFTRSKKPGRIIHLGDGSELFTDRTVGVDGQDMTTSSEEEETDESEEEKMQVDGHRGQQSKSETATNATTLKATDIAKPKTETRRRSPGPTAADAGPGSPSSHK
jgi:hypothetical protein